MTNLSSVFFIIVSGVAVILGIVAGFIVILRRVLFHHSKLAELMSSYPVEFQPEGLVLKKQTIGLGRSVRFRKCTRVCISQAGLYLAINVVFGKESAFLIPWNHISPAVATRLYGLNALGFSVGAPEITSIKVYPDLFEKIKNYLPGDKGRHIKTTSYHL